VDLFKTMELLNNRYAFCIVTNSAHETPVYPLSFISAVDKMSVCWCTGIY